jgi:dienelactone hydrolase
MPTWLRFCALLGLVFFLTSATASAADTTRGDHMLEAYFRGQVKQIADGCLADACSLAAWEKQKPELRRQLLDMLGLWPLPPRTDLQLKITGRVETERFTVEKLVFQSSPGLYVTANLYLPKHLTQPAPAVLYVCGHANRVIDNISYGSKVPYQRYPTWLAEHGYVCLIVDTLELAEIRGEHHGTYRQNRWWWQSLGYTPAGIECWNGMRAIDYLQSRKEVDPKRIGLTGRSGGGATSWYLAATDERVTCAIPVAGIDDLETHLIHGEVPRLREGVIAGHCDCMYMVNTYRWDFPMVAALIAPRPLILGNADRDEIFPMVGARRLADKVKRVYDLYGAGDHFFYLETPGGHTDTPELRHPTYRWLNRWLKDDTGPIDDPEREPLKPEQLKVFQQLPEDEINTRIDETFIKTPPIELPRVPAVAKEWWAGKSEEWRKGLRDHVFAGWPSKPGPLNDRPIADVRHEGLRVRAYDFTSEDNVELRLWLVTAEKTEKPSLVVLTALDEPGWKEWQNELGPVFQSVLLLHEEPIGDPDQYAQTQRVLEKNKWAYAMLAPRGIGPTRWSSADTPADAHIRRRFALLGQTVDGQRAWDVRRGLAVLRKIPDLQGSPLWLQGKKDMAGVVLYAGLFEPDVVRFDLWHPAASHRQGPTFLNVLRMFDMPQAMALAFPRSVIVYVKDAEEARAWKWPTELQQSLGINALKVRMVPD